MAYPAKRKAADLYDDDTEDTEGLVNDTTGIGGDEYYPMDDETTGQDEAVVDDPADDVTPHPEPDGDEVPADDMKPGARALTELHDHIMDIGEIVDRLSRNQEHPEVQKHLDKFAAKLDKDLTDLQGLFSKLYPDHEQPGAGAEPLPGEGDEPVEDEYLDEDMEKSVDGMSEGTGEDGGYTVDDTSSLDDEDEAVVKKRAAVRKRFIKRLDLARTYRELIRAKRYGGSHAETISKAASHLEEVAQQIDEDIYKSACLYHANALRGLKTAKVDIQTPQKQDAALAELRKHYTARIDRLVGQIKAITRNSRLTREGR
jgi:hypothetical protein